MRIRINRDASADATPASVSKASPTVSPREWEILIAGSLTKMVLEGDAADVILSGSRDVIVMLDEWEGYGFQPFQLQY